MHEAPSTDARPDSVARATDERVRSARIVGGLALGALDRGDVAEARALLEAALAVLGAS